MKAENTKRNITPRMFVTRHNQVAVINQIDDCGGGYSLGYIIGDDGTKHKHWWYGALSEDAELDGMVLVAEADAPSGRDLFTKYPYDEPDYWTKHGNINAKHRL